MVRKIIYAWQVCKHGMFCFETPWWSVWCKKEGFSWFPHRSEDTTKVSNQVHSLPSHPWCGHWLRPAGPAGGSPCCASSHSKCCPPGSRSLCQRTAGFRTRRWEIAWHRSGKSALFSPSDSYPHSGGGWLRSVQCIVWLLLTAACSQQTLLCLECLT